MEHEVFVPVPVQRLREALADPARVARAVPGLQQDAGTEPVAGRLKVRIGSHSITYRGSLRIGARDDGTYAVEGEATESRGAGAVKLALTLAVRGSGCGSTLVVDGTVTADGRVTELAPESVRTAMTRLLNRFAENLAEAAGDTATDGPGTGVAEPAGDESAGDVSAGDVSAGDVSAADESGTDESSIPRFGTPEALATEDFAPQSAGEFEAAPDADDAPVPPPVEGSAPPGQEAGPRPPAPAEHTSVFDTEVPPPSLDPLADDEEPGEDRGEREEGTEPDDTAEATPSESLPESVSATFEEAEESPAEAAHARRTMIGRSAEEVDHAPPRGRYAPVPAPLTVSGNPALRWAAPAAALVVASAIVLGRALRRRR
ncbi:SRPBCC domain-containing protein [Streptomyces sp. NPDC003374]